MLIPKFYSPKIKDRRTVSFNCTNEALKEVITLLLKLKSMGDLGSSREIDLEDFGSVFFDGDGPDKLGYITVDGMSIEEWEKEEKRLRDIQNERLRKDSLKLIEGVRSQNESPGEDRTKDEFITDEDNLNGC